MPNSTQQRNYNYTEEEVEYIKNRIFMYNDDIVYYKEITKLTLDSIDICAREMKKYFETTNARYLVIDLNEAGKPTSEHRAALREGFERFADKAEHVTAFSSGILFTLIAKFILRATGFKSISYHKSLEQALKAIEEHPSFTK